ncbi:ABC transporter ATP-binding protein [Myceligenerans xiligouense]|uniref:Amino acid/amide ABC transporter ATP-binding protein 1 (HAAT family) n=1 Tax=Myceligenerans xiligouense TaxID=253184 RepID=A0A3N4ZI15_9MICO|nr:ABC transporter ATP-binding protein [Myceligenerans xiligouense]RPF19551.1 amino acid/amide ABC transporter ATP-binding protein 1 (HAAT family) [Myceligenerans xiligouense]
MPDEKTVNENDAGAGAGGDEQDAPVLSETAKRAGRDLSHVAPEVGVAKPDAILTARGVQRRFGGMTAVDVDYLEVERGTITALIGPNGAGKTTFFNLLTGFDKPNQGSWTFQGEPIAHKSAARVARAGMVRTFQLTKALSRLTVLENVLLAATKNPGERMFASMFQPIWAGTEARNKEKALEILERFKLDTMRDEFAGSLSGGQRKLLEMARALMTDPAMIMLDEPMAGVNPALVQSLLGHIQDLRDEGMSVLFVEHDMHAVRHISDWVVVMAEGRIVAEGPPGSVMKNEAVVDAYLGAHHDTDLGDDALLDPEVLARLEAEEEKR